ncbi:MAG TPA: hypothetical protein VHD81_00855 [Mycobacteriales bacterium]|nr:hypothetical protein [Mycobacteriales bacterium]
MIDLSGVRSRLDSAVEIIRELDGSDLVDTDSGNPTGSKDNTADRQRAASISRELLHLADHLEMTASLVREQYWSMKGLAP